MKKTYVQVDKVLFDAILKYFKEGMPEDRCFLVDDCAEARIYDELARQYPDWQVADKPKTR